MTLNEMIRNSLTSIRHSVKTKGARATVESQCWLWALIGAVVIGVTLPTLLVCWNCGERGPLDFDPVPAVPGGGVDWLHLVENWVGLQVVATIFCGPGAIILGWVLYTFCKKRCLDESKTLRDIVVFGMWFGGIAAFLNFPGLLSANLLRKNSIVLVPLLFAVAGASCGAWVAWQAWRATHSQERFWPRFSLATLMIAVFAWGILLAVFAPK